MLLDLEQGGEKGRGTHYYNNGVEELGEELGLQIGRFCCSAASMNLLCCCPATIHLHAAELAIAICPHICLLSSLTCLKLRTGQKQYMQHMYSVDSA
jgi:hypothetical protein